MSDSDPGARVPDDHAIDRVAAQADPLPAGAERQRALDRVKQGLLGRAPGSADETLGGDATELSADGVRPSTAELSAGRVLMDRYVILAPLGHGGMGAVYDAYDPKLSRRVAVKLLHPEVAPTAASGEGAARLLREAQALAKVSHPNVVEVHDVGEIKAEDGSTTAGIFIVLERLDGQTFDTWAEQPRPRAQLQRAYLDAARGLSAAHDQGVIHRDVKPSNLMICVDGRVKVVDFGLARDDRPDVDSGQEWPAIASPNGQLTKPGQVMGTLLYMAPEQHDGDVADAAADQYSLCVALAGALLGRDLFERSSVVTLSLRKRSREFAGPGLDALPGWLRRPLERGLAPNPRDRFESMHDLVAALERDPWRWPRRLGIATAVVGTLAAIALGASVLTEPAYVEIAVTDGREPVADARVFVDGELVPHRAAQVDAGPHTIAVEAPGFIGAEQVVEVDRGELRGVVIPLRHETGRLLVRAEPDTARVFIDGVDHGSRLVRAELPTGPYTVAVQREGYYRHVFEWAARADDDAEADVALLPARVWSDKAPGPLFTLQWAGDSDGDGRQELIKHVFSTVTRVDPWRDRPQWTLVLPNPSVAFVGDVSDDGIPDIAAVDSSSTALRVTVYDGSGSRGAPTQLWHRALPRSRAGEPLLLRPIYREGPKQLLVVSPANEEVVVLAAATGRPLWSATLGEIPHRATLFSHADGPALAVATEGGMRAFHADTGRELWRAPHLAIADGDPGFRADAALSISFRELTANSSPALASVAAPDADGDNLVLYSFTAPERSAVTLIDGRSGAELWTRAIDRAVGRRWPRMRWDPHARRTHVAIPKDGSVTSLDLESGAPRWHGGDLEHKITSLRWAELDGRVVGLAATRESVLQLDPNTGEVVLEVATQERSNTAPDVHDIDGDGVPELVTFDSSSPHRVLEIRDRKLQVIERIDLGPTAAGFAPTGDADGDGAPEGLVRGAELGVLVGRTAAWIRRSNGPVRAAPFAIDIDGDGRDEVGVCGAFGSDDIVALDLSNGRTRWGVTLPSSPPIRAPLAVATPAGAELIGAHGSRLVQVGVGGHEPTLHSVGHAYASPAAADVDGDGHDDLALPTWIGSLEVYRSADFTKIWTAPLHGPSFGKPLVVDGPTGAHLVVTTMEGWVARFDGNGTMVWEQRVGTQISHGARLLGTEAPAVVIAGAMDEGSVIAALDLATGTLRWEARDAVAGAVTIADVDHDGHFEIYGGAHDGGLAALDEDGAPRWHAPLGTRGYKPRATSPVLVHQPADGGATVALAGFADGSVRAVNPRDGAHAWRYFLGAEVEGTPLALVHGPDAATRIVAADIDGAVHAFDPPRTD